MKKFAIGTTIIGLVILHMIANAGTYLTIRVTTHCLQDTAGYMTNWTIENRTNTDLDITGSQFRYPSGDIVTNVINGAIPANGIRTYEHAVPNQPEEFAELQITVKVSETVSETDQNRNWISGHCPGPDATPTPTETVTIEPSLTPTETPTTTPTETATTTPVLTVTPGETTLPTATPTNTATSVTFTATPGYDPTVVIYPTATTVICTEEKCMEAYCEWLSSAPAIWIRSAGDIGPLFSKQEFEGWDVLVSGYYLKYQATLAEVNAIAIPGLIMTDMQCSACPSAPLTVKIDGEWFGLYLPNISNISNLALSFQAQDIEVGTSVLWAISIANQYNTTGNYTPGYYRVSGPIGDN